MDAMVTADNEENNSDSSASSVASSDWLQLEMLLNFSPRKQQQQLQFPVAVEKDPTVASSQVVKTVQRRKSLAGPAASADSANQESSPKRVDISEYVRILQRLRGRRNLLGMDQQQQQRLKAAQKRLRQILSAADDDASAQLEDADADSIEDVDEESPTSKTLLDCSTWNSSSLVAAATAQQRPSIESIGKTGKEHLKEHLNKEASKASSAVKDESLREVATIDQVAIDSIAFEPQSNPEDQGAQAPIATGGLLLRGRGNMQSTMLSQTDLPVEVLRPSKAKKNRRNRSQQQISSGIMGPKTSRGQSLPPSGLRSHLALAPLVSCRLSEMVLSMAFDPVGRRLICFQPNRGISFRAITGSGDDLESCEQLNWRIWARSISVLPSGHLLVANPGFLQVVQPDGTCLAMSERRSLIVSMTVYDRLVIALTYGLIEKNGVKEQTYSMFVYELPRLTPRHRHPLNGILPGGLRCPEAMCALRGLAVVDQIQDTLRTIEIDTGRLRQSVMVSNVNGPKQLAACDSQGLLFVSVISDRSINIFHMCNNTLVKVGTYRDPLILPGPMAWVPGNGILTCACSLAGDPRRHELRTFRLHDANRMPKSPKSILIHAV